MKLSVCIVTYNQERFIEQCIVSALNQTVSFDYEIVVGEDCSTDGTLAILERLAAAHPGVLKIRHRAVNLGAEKNFDTTISECSGEYIAFLEGDNWWTSPDKLQRQVEMLDAHPDMSFCFHRTRYVDTAGRSLPTVMPPEDPPMLSGFEFLMQESNPVALGSVVARTALLSGWQDWLGGLKLGDWPLCLMLGSRGRVGFVAQDMSVQRVHAGGSWSFLSPPTQVMYVLQMLDRVAPLLNDAQRQMLFLQRTARINWWSKQMVYEPSVRVDQELESLGRLNDPALAISLLAGIAETARIAVESARIGAKTAQIWISDLQNTIQTAVSERNDALHRMVDLEMQLARARGRPFKQMRDLLRFKLLSFLSRQTKVIPPRMAARFARSANKRDPNRSTTGWIGLSQSANARTQSLEPAKLGKDGSIRYSGSIPADPTKPTILVVSHEVGRTGAPILALNIVMELAKRYNVVSLGLRGGDILGSFRASSIEVHVADTFHHDDTQYRGLIENLCTTFNFAFAIVNSVESRAVLKPLATFDIPTVTLLHEFAAYTRPKNAFLEVFKWSTETIFSTEVTLRNALQEHPTQQPARLHVLPQGKCAVPMSISTEPERQAERAWLQKSLRPDQSRKPFLVLGAGAVQIRKGVDLFLETATRVIKSPGGQKFQFAWIGHGYDPERDLAYSVYLQDQIRRAGIEEQVVFLRETSEIEFAYELADVFLLSSRLDPLPNVAIDALSVGLPVLCFRETTGIADFLVQKGLGPYCVANYIDTHDIAGKLMALESSPDLRADVATQSKELAAEYFNFFDYVSKVERIALDAGRALEQREDDAKTILASGLFRQDFNVPASSKARKAEEAVTYYLAATASGIGSRKPMPGFHPYIYSREQQNDRLITCDPFADFIRHEQPAGPWLQQVIVGGMVGDQTDARGVPDALRVALHIHAYYPDMLDELLGRLSRNASKPDLFLSVSSERAAAEARRTLLPYALGRIDVRVVPNVGRDIGPLLTEFGPSLVTSYDVVGHLHTKRSMGLENAAFVESWNHFNLENMLGGAQGGRMVDLILSEMAHDASIGVVYPDDPHLLGWGGNRKVAEELMRALGSEHLPDATNFPVGSMFWMRSSSLKPLVDLKLTWADYPPEPLAYDGTMLHAIERLFGLVSGLDGKRSVVTNIPGLTRE